MLSIAVGVLLVVLVGALVVAVDRLCDRDDRLCREHRRRMQAEERYRRLVDLGGPLQ